MPSFPQPAMWGWITLGVVVLLYVVRQVRYYLTVPPPCTQSQHVTGNPADKITMVQLAPGGPPMVGSVSPFCVKLETLLRMAGLPHTLKDGLPNDAPKGKLPYLRHGDVIVADSSLAAKYLENTYGAGFGGKMLSLSQATPEQCGIAIAVQRLLENDLYYAVLHTRWMEDYGFSYVCRASFGMMPWPLKALVPRLVRRLLWAQLNAHGISLLSHEERVARTEENLAALSAILGDKQWFLGGTLPSVLDASAFGMLEQVVNGPRGNGEWMSAILARHANLVAYVDRVRNLYFATAATSHGQAESKKHK